ncbi:serine/threonine-protein kinase STY13-like [Triticum urartu]|uniref:serine/threonine-protein kinase STY13-like n=1 Tax=Triticum urartu TaxID=4572 RepID=UPI002042C04B|nr:serine/threonine-protein kinase STY13-like [Triticum urartu]
MVKRLRKGGGDRPMASREIDLAKLDIHHRESPGSFGSFCSATYNGRQVLAKVLEWGEDGFMTEAEISTQSEAFRKEVAVWKELKHQSVARFIGASMDTTDRSIPADSGESSAPRDLPERACCVVFEYLYLGSLRRYLYAHRARKIGYKIVVEFALDLANGLSYLHSKNIVHRNVKPESMLLGTEEAVVKIADFGFACVQAKNPEDMTGALGYMAPEVIEGKPYDRKSDVYSFGICLWGIYCCDMPYYPDMSSVEVSFAVVHNNLRPKIPRCCLTRLANIMKRCWDADPDKRPEMKEVVHLLEDLDTTKGGGMIPEGTNPGCFCFFRPRRVGP